MEIEFPDLTQVAAVLEPDERVTRQDSRPEPVRDALSVGMPVVQDITADLVGEDLALRAFLADGNAQWRYHLVHLGTSFTPADGAHFGQAWLTMRLTRDDEATPPAIVWSVTPQRSEQSVERPKTVKLGAKLVFEASAEIQSTSKHTAVFLDSYGLLEPSCTWEFTRTSLHEIRGSQRLSAVIRTPRDATVTGSIDLRATLTRRRFGMFSFRVALDNGSPIAFTLGA